MFLLSFTQESVTDRLQSFNPVEIQNESFKVTIVTDNFLSRFSQKPDGFSIVESPLLSAQNSGNLILSELNYNNADKCLTVKPIISAGRPLYYHINLKGEFFCSTHISMLRNAGVTIDENQARLPEFFVYRFIMPPETLYKNIMRLVNGTQMRVKMEDGRCKITHQGKYEPPTFNCQKSSDLDGISEITLACLNESIQELGSCQNKPLVLLSGGLDSSILYKVCKDVYSIGTSYSTGYPFESPGLNTEKEYALSAAEAFGAKHNYYKSTTDEYLHGLLESISLVEEPIQHLQAVMFHLLFKNGMPNEKGIVVSGEGADCVFGTFLHKSIFHGERRKLFSKFPFLNLLKFISHKVGKGSGLVNSLVRYANTCHYSIDEHAHLVWDVDAYGSEDWVCKYFNVGKDDIIEGRYNAVQAYKDRSIYDVISILKILGGVACDQAIWWKLGEAHKKIIYYPFMDSKLIKSVFNTPWDIKLKSNKHVLREVARQLKVPDFIINRPKSGFGIRDIHWAERGGVFEPMVSLASKVFDEKQIRDMQSTNPEKAMTFWNILNYSIWKRLCVDNEPLDKLSEELNKSISDTEHSRR